MLTASISGGTWMIWTAIALGSAIGGVLRHAVAESVIRLGGSVPGGTLCWAYLAAVPATPRRPLPFGSGPCRYGHLPTNVTVGL